MAQAQARSRPFPLPDDLTGLLIAAIPRDSLNAAALVCHKFHAVIAGPQFPTLRQQHGFAERGIVVVKSDEKSSAIEIRLASQSDVVTRIPGSYRLRLDISTTDGARLFFSGGADAREPFPTTGMTACAPRPSPSARDMQVSLSHYRLGFTL